MRTCRRDGVKRKASWKRKRRLESIVSDFQSWLNLKSLSEVRKRRRRREHRKTIRLEQWRWKGVIYTRFMTPQFLAMAADNLSAGCDVWGYKTASIN